MSNQKGTFECPHNCGRGPWPLKAHLAAHINRHHAGMWDVQPEREPIPQDIPEVELPEAPEPALDRSAPGKPAIIPEWRRATRLQHGQRSVTFLRPVCRTVAKDGCQDSDNVPWNWYEDCPHDPYVTMVKRTPPPQYVDAGNGMMREVISDVVYFTPHPNTVEITINMRLNNGLGEPKARKKGYILPEELRSPTYPNGIAPACQFRDCKWQRGLERYASGTFCREIEAQLVAIDDKGTTLEVGWNETESLTKRQDQLEHAL